MPPHRRLRAGRPDRFRRGGGLLRALAIAAVTCAAAPEPPHLRYGGSSQVLVEQRSDPFALRKYLYPALKEAGIRRIELVAGAESIVQQRSASGMMYLDGLPPPALQTLMLVLSPESAGKELDVFVEGRGAPADPDRIWTVRRDLSGNVVVLKGAPPIVLDGPDPTPETLAARFGIGALEDSPDARWSADERRAIAQALELLAPAELDLVRGVSFLRAKSEKDGHAGTYRGGASGEPGRITIFDVAFTRAQGRVRYGGSPERAVPTEVFLILHEIGHAVADAQRRLLRLRRSEQSAAFDALSAQYVVYTDEYKRIPTTANAGTDASERRSWLEVEMPRIYAELQRRVQEIERRDEEIERLYDLSTVESTYAALPGAIEGPTEYARRGPAESFAEAFALYRTDPDSLRWIAPGSHDWFASSAHLEIATPTLPAVGAPPTPSPDSPDESAPSVPALEVIDAPR